MKKRSSATSEQILELLYEKREALRNELNSVEMAIKVVNSISEIKVKGPKTKNCCVMTGDSLVQGRVAYYPDGIVAWPIKD